MTTTANGNGSAPEVDVVVVGAGPVGLTLANVLGLQGVRTLVVDERDALIDYPRGVGLDDEGLRTFQAIGLVDAVLPNTVPNQIFLRFFYDGKRRLLARWHPPRRAIRLAQAQRSCSRWSMPSYTRDSTGSTTSRWRGGATR